MEWDYSLLMWQLFTLKTNVEHVLAIIIGQHAGAELCWGQTGPWPAQVFYTFDFTNASKESPPAA